MSIKTIFLDRDGVINKEKNYLYKIKDFEFIDGIFDACLYLQNLNYKIIIITNQSGIGRKFYSESDYQKITNWMLLQFEIKNINILDIMHCPHLPSDICTCRKPMPGMFISSMNKHNIDMEKSWMVGDKEEDILAANAANINRTILVRSGHKINEDSSSAKYFLESVNDIKKVVIN
ncbi:D-glycero-beta-D-manno-heptose 1,7-bisphosphate 7-phosphatase [Candidatus Thioglobus sp.]|nr:D-glycero-beta-D-manno-heptose 1,7-bisphosphate 7-phosphatase [Candidatus Thioglobus sp.]